MSSSRQFTVLVALIAGAAASASAQRVGGGGPGVSHPSAPVGAPGWYGAQVIVMPRAGTTARGAPVLRSRGGSWDGSRPTAGGSPVAQARPPRPDYSAYFGYAAPSPQVVVQRAVPPEAQRTRDAYAERRGRP